MFRNILSQILLLISIFLVQFSLCDIGQNNQQGNQNDPGNQNGGQGDHKDPKYYCDGFELTCPFKKIRLVLHKIKTAVTPSQDGFHLHEFKWHNPFAGNSDNDKNKNNQNGDSQNQHGGSGFDPPKYDPPDYKPQNPFASSPQGGNNN